MPIDTSIYNTKTPEPFNPLASYGKFAEIGNALQTNKLLQQQEQYKAQANPLDIDQKKAQLAMTHYDNMVKFLSPLAAKPNLTHADIANETANGVANNLFTTDEATRELSSLGPDTPENNRAFVGQLLFRAQSAADQLKTLSGENQAVNVGDQTLLGVRQSPMFGGGFDVTNTLTQGLTPGENVTTQPALTSKGAKGTTAISEKYDRTGHVLPSQNTGAPTPDEEVITPGDNLGASTQRGALNAKKGNVTPIELPPGEAQSMERGAEQGDLLRRTADSVPQRKALLGQMEALIKTGDFNTGPGADKWKDLVAGLQRPFGVQSQSVSSLDEFKKLATQVAQQQFQTLGGTGTDAKLDSAISTSPSSALSNLSNERIIGLLKGNEDAINVKNKEWQSYKQQHGAGSYGEFSNSFNQIYDPRVFQAQYLFPNERKKMLQGFNPKELEKYKKDYQTAGERGWIQ